MATTAQEAARIRSERQVTYGTPEENHKGVAMVWAPILHAHRHAVSAMEPLPGWVVAMLMMGLKYNRMRRVFSKDTYDDVRIYSEFAEDWQSRAARPRADAPQQVLVLGELSKNVNQTLTHLKSRGHTPLWGGTQMQDRDLVETLLRRWATAVYLTDDHEPWLTALASECGLWVWTRPDDVPDASVGRATMAPAAELPAAV